MFAFGQPKQPKNRQCQFSGGSAFHCRYNSYEASRVKEYSTIDMTPIEQVNSTVDITSMETLKHRFL